MPTCDRRPFVPRAIRYFLRQTYEPRELVIVDDGATLIDDLVPADDRIRYIRLERRVSLGEKRNVACEAARGQLIAHWDDDDWMAPWRLDYQVQSLTDSNADLCGLNRILFFDPSRGLAWLYRFPSRQRPWVAGGTMCYRRDLWESRPFARVNIGEDNRFVRGLNAGRVLALPDADFYIAIIHRGNTSAKRTRSNRWQAQPLGRIKSLLGDDWGLDGVVDDAVAIRGGRHPASSHDDSATTAPNPTTVTVSIPHFRCRAYIRRAVESILGQTYGDLTVIVANDGDPNPPWDLLEDINDPRLIRFDLGENRGRYFADAVVLEASSDKYFLIQDADDWSDSYRLEKLLQALRQGHAVASLSTSVIHRVPGTGTTDTGRRQCYRKVNRPLTRRLEHRADHHGLFDAQILRSIGGYYGGLRVGYDTFLVSLLLMLGRIAYVDEPLYHRILRPDSLTSASSTGMRSTHRSIATAKLRKMYATLFHCHQRYLSGGCDRARLATTIRKLIIQQVSDEERTALTREAQRLRQQLHAAQTQPSSLEVPKRRLMNASSRPTTLSAEPDQISINDVLSDRSLHWGGWSITNGMAQELYARLCALRPQRVLEAGSGNSTLVLAQYAAESGAVVVSLEHDRQFHARTLRLLERRGLARHVDLRLAEIRELRHPESRNPWYDVKLDGMFDFVLVDGPPLRVGRDATLAAINKHLAPHWELWLNDGYRAHELDCVTQWEQQYEFHSSLHDIDATGVWILRDIGGVADLDRTKEPPLAVGIGLLTGHRCALLRRTLNSIEQRIPNLLADHYVLVLINGRDPETLEYVSSRSWVDRWICNNDMLPVGPATSLLIKQLIDSGSHEFVLHLEDDWCVDTRETTWLRRSCRLLKERSDVGQVRLRRSTERVLKRHMITRETIRWEDKAGFRTAKTAHFTFNPSLLRAADVNRTYPCSSEQDAQRRFLGTGLATAQLLPGVFRHIGAGQSLRAAPAVPTPCG